MQRRVMLWVCLLGVLAPAGALRARDVDDERVAKVEAAFVLNFMRYTQWPDSRFDGPESPIRVRVVGEPRMHPYLRAIVQDERVEGRPIEVQTVEWPDKPDDDEAWRVFVDTARAGHVVVVGPTLSNRVRRMLLTLRDHPCLTISDAAGFVDAGGMIGLYVRHGRVVFDANQQAMERAGVELSSKVLRLAQRVKEAE